MYSICITFLLNIYLKFQWGESDLCGNLNETKFLVDLGHHLFIQTIIDPSYHHSSANDHPGPLWAKSKSLQFGNLRGMLNKIMLKYIDCALRITMEKQNARVSVISTHRQSARQVRFHSKYRLSIITFRCLLCTQHRTFNVYGLNLRISCFARIWCCKYRMC